MKRTSRIRFVIFGITSVTGLLLVSWYSAFQKASLAPPQSYRSAPHLAPGTPASQSLTDAPRGRRTTDQVEGPFPFKRVAVLSIGVNWYPQLHSVGPVHLRVAEADAMAFAELAKRHYGYVTETLLGAEATKQRIEQALAEYGRELGDDDALIVFFAGHGHVIERPRHGEAGFLIPSDARLDLDDSTDVATWSDQALDMKQLTDQMDGMSARHVLFIADACCSGFMTTRGALGRWDHRNFLRSRSRTVLAASTRSQRVPEPPGADHSPFTTALLRELEKEDAASVLDVFVPVLRTVSERSNGRLLPQLAQVGDGDGMFVFIPRSISREEIEADLQDGSAESIGRHRGLAGVINRVNSHAKQRTTHGEFLELLDTPDYRLSDRAEDLRTEWEAKFERFRRNAQLGDVWAMAALCLCYEKGFGTDKDGDRSYYWARQTDRAKNPAGLGRYLLGRCYQSGLGVALTGQAARDEAKRLYRESAERGFGPGLRARAATLLADSPKEVDAAKRLLEEAIANQVTGAKTDLAELLLRAEGRDGESLTQALKLLEEPAARDDARAHLLLYLALGESGEATPAPDRKKAESHLRRAADLGLPEALFALGCEYLGSASRLGLERDERLAFRLCDRAAQGDHPESLLQTAVLLADGRGTPVDHTLARERLERAIRLDPPWGNADSIQGDWYLAGKVYPRDEARALACFVRGADKGLVRSCILAGSMYFEGRGFTRRNGLADGAYHDDWHRGLHYFVKAARRGGPDEQGVADRVTRRFVDRLEGGALSRRIDADIARGRPRGHFDDQLREKHGGASGGPGERRPIQFQDGGPLTVETISGEQITRATAIARAWRADYPETFRAFCERWSVDPGTLVVRPPGPGEGQNE